MAAFSGRTFGGVCQLRCSHFLKATLQSSGTPPNATKLLGINGRSCREAARIPYSCAKTSADANSADRDEASSPTILLECKVRVLVPTHETETYT